MKTTNLQRHIPKVRVALATAIAAEFEEQLLYMRHVELNVRIPRHPAVHSTSIRPVVP